MSERRPSEFSSETQNTGYTRGSEASGVRYERLLMRISSSLASAPWRRLGAAVDAGLKDVLDACCLDLIGIFEVLHGGRGAYLRYVASAGDMPAVPDPFNYHERFPWAFQKVVLGGDLVKGAQPDLPEDAETDRESMCALQVSSLIHIPLQVDGKVAFVLTLAGSPRAPGLTEENIGWLKALGEIIAQAIGRAEAVGALLANRDDLRDVLEVAHLGHWEWDIGADKLQLSDEAKHILGADVPALEDLMDLVQPPDRRPFAKAIEHARAQPLARFKLRYAIRTPAGETRTIQQWHEVISPGERTGRLMATVQDISSLVGTEREVTTLREHHWHSARVAQTTLLVASLAHELCQPLAAILNNAQAGLRFLGRGQFDADEMGDILTDIVASNRKANEVLGALRAMLRRQHTTRITFDAVDAVHDVLALVRSELMTEQIDVQTELEGGSLVDADKVQIEQVVLNLVMNSIDAMRGTSEPPRCIQLAVRGTPDEQVEVSVRDSGRGIPREKRPKVFEAFWTTKEKGLGMGLPLCRAIVESYDGRIWCEDNEGGGITFRFRLPVAGRDEQPSAASLVSEPAVGGPATERAEVSHEC